MKPGIDKVNVNACVGCGHCTFSCPAAHYERDFSPRGIAESYILHGPGRLDLWSCVTCAACREVCPEGVDFPRFMVQSRRERRTVDIPVRTHAGIMESIRGIQATGKGTGIDHDWLKDGLRFDDSSDVAIFIGCIPLLDIVFSDLKVDLKGSIRSMVQLLNRMGIEPKLIEGERCCGHDAYWLGEEEVFGSLAESNRRAIEKAGVKEIITVCPECSHTLGQIYQEHFGGVLWKVRHISEVLAEAVEDGRLKLEKSEELATYQDPCRLGRHSGVYDAPRKAISSVADIVEMPRSREIAACCGSTCFVQCDHIVKKWQVHRLDEARSTNAVKLITACPKCMIHLSCAQKDFGTHKDRLKITIQDLTSLMAERL